MATGWWTGADVPGKKDRRQTATLPSSPTSNLEVCWYNAQGQRIGGGGGASFLREGAKQPPPFPTMGRLIPLDTARNLERVPVKSPSQEETVVDDTRAEVVPARKG